MTDTDGVDGQLRALGALRDELQERDDKIRDRLREFEDAMASLRLGVPIQALVRQDAVEGTSEDWLTVLSFRKAGGRWKLYKEEGLDGDPETWSRTHILACGREFRAAVVADYFERLLDEAVDTVATKIRERDQGLRRSQKTLDALQNYGRGRAASRDKKGGAP